MKTRYMQIGIIMLAILTFLIGWSIAGIEDYIFSVEIDPVGFMAKVKELNSTFTAPTPEAAFDKAVASIKSHKKANSQIPTKIADIEAQIKALQAEKVKLEAQLGKEPEVYALVDPKYLDIYRSRLKILTTTTGIEEKFEVDVYSVLYKPKTSIYGTPLIHGWQFHKWDDTE